MKLRRLLFRIATVIAAVAFSIPVHAAADEPDSRPRLVVFLVIDQFRTDYVTRFDPYFSDGGFRRLRRDGAFFANAYYSYGATATAAGHATIGSGRLPRDHGVISNDWAHPDGPPVPVAAVLDLQTQLVGRSGDRKAEGRSPACFAGHSFGDQLKISDPRSRVFGIAWKDRAAILLTGRNADGAFWFDRPAGGFVTSTYYAQDLITPIRQFNEERWAERFSGKVWEPLLPTDAYASCRVADEKWAPIYEAYGHKFPHALPTLTEKTAKDDFNLLSATPFGNDVVLEAARRLVIGEGLGRGEAVDVLGVSLSSNDIVGHYFGPESPEVLDIAVRTDAQLAEFLTFLDDAVGPGAYLLALTADHGVTSSPHVVRPTGVPAAFIDFRTLCAEINGRLSEHLGAAAPKTPLVLGAEVPWIFCSTAFVNLDDERRGELSRLVVENLRRAAGIADVFTAAELAGPAPSRDDRERWLAWRSYHVRRGGQFYLSFDPYIYEVDDKIAGHSMGYTHDRHVPILLVGPGVRPGRYFSPADPLDIVPTLAAILGVEPPLGAAGRILDEALAP